MKYSALVKGVAQLVASYGTGMIVGNIISATTPPETRLVPRLAIGLAGFFVAGMIGEKVGTYVGEQFDLAFGNIPEPVGLPDKDIQEIKEKWRKVNDDNAQNRPVTSKTTG